MLDVQDLRSGYDRTEVLHGVSLQVRPDGVTAVLGHNGAGKSTLLKTILGLLPATSGRIELDGEDITRLPGHARVRRGLAWVPQGQRSFGTLTTSENLQVVADRFADGRARIDDALEMFPALVPLLERHAGLLSGGQRQQLAIARALITRPRLLVLDEPTEGIQPSVVGEIERTIVDLAGRTGTQILLAEQKVGFALSVADDYVVLASGHLADAGDSDDTAPTRAREALAI